MIKTELLELPIYDTPDTDVFDLQDWNIANMNIENAIKDIVGGEGTVNVVNQEVVDARKGKETLLEKIDEMDLADLTNTEAIETVKERVNVTEGDITTLKDKVTGLSNFKENGGEMNGELTVDTSMTIKDDTLPETRIKLKSSAGNLRVVRYDIQTPHLQDELFSVTYARDGDTKSFNFGNYEKDTNGYTYLPNGFIIQWGTVTLPATTGTSTFNLPTRFPNANLNAQVTIFDQGNISSSSACRLLNFGVSSIQIANSLNVSTKATYFCIGY